MTTLDKLINEFNCNIEKEGNINRFLLIKIAELYDKLDKCKSCNCNKCNKSVKSTTNSKKK